jgi:hypothetical protein
MFNNISCYFLTLDAGQGANDCMNGSECIDILNVTFAGLTAATADINGR